MLNYTLNGHNLDIFIKHKYLIFNELHSIEKLNPRPFTVYSRQSCFCQTNVSMSLLYHYHYYGLNSSVLGAQGLERSVA
jgi:hypothetical protein